MDGDRHPHVESSASGHVRRRAPHAARPRDARCPAKSAGISHQHGRLRHVCQRRHFGRGASDRRVPLRGLRLSGWGGRLDCDRDGAVSRAVFADRQPRAGRVDPAVGDFHPRAAERHRESAVLRNARRSGDIEWKRGRGGGRRRGRERRPIGTGRGREWKRKWCRGGRWRRSGCGGGGWSRRWKRCGWKRCARWTGRGREWKRKWCCGGRWRRSRCGGDGWSRSWKRCARRTGRGREWKRGRSRGSRRCGRPRYSGARRSCRNWVCSRSDRRRRTCRRNRSFKRGGAGPRAGQSVTFDRR